MEITEQELQDRADLVDAAATVRAAWLRVRLLVRGRFHEADRTLEAAIQAERDATAARLEVPIDDADDAERVCSCGRDYYGPAGRCGVCNDADPMGEDDPDFEPEDVEELGLAEAARRDLDAAGLWPGGRTYVEHQGDPYAGEVPEAEVALECGRCGHSQVVNGETVTWAELREECTNCGGMMKAPAWVIARLREANLDQELGPDYGAGQGQVEALCRCGAREVFCPESAPDVPGPCPECGTERTW